MLVAAFDPGRNIGFALVDEQGGLLRSRIIVAEELPFLDVSPHAAVVVGDGTGSERIASTLESLGWQVQLVDETDTSLEGRELYFRDHPPGLPWRWLPSGMWIPPRPIDDYAAYAIALRFLATLGA